MAIGDRIEIARQDTLENINVKTDGIKTVTSAIQNTVNTLNNNIGAANQTGGTTIAGSVMAKLNAILSKTPNLDATISSVNTNINAVKTNTNANHTANATGTLSQKLTHIINTINTHFTSFAGSFTALNNHLTNGTYGLNAIKSSLRGISASSTGTGTVLYNNAAQLSLRINRYHCIAKAIAPADGIYTAAITIAQKSPECKILKIMEIMPQPYVRNSNSFCARYINPCALYIKTTIGAEVTESNDEWADFYVSETYGEIGRIPGSKTTTIYFHANKGEPIVLLGCPTTGDTIITNVSVSYQA